MYQDDVCVIERVTGIPPFHVFGQRKFQHNRPQFLECFLPLAGFVDQSIDFGIGGVHAMIFYSSQRMSKPILIIFSGLPGTGKTTLAKRLTARLNAVYLRADTIETALVQ